MIKFFRKIRQKLLSENKFSKYLIYAVGEIILVVIGILIALQINTWNDSRKQNILEDDFINGIKNDLKQDKEYILMILNINKEKDSIYEIINSDLFDLYDNNRSKLDSLLNQFIANSRTFYPAVGTFESAISGNDLGKFKNKFFSTATTKLYNSTYTRLNDNAKSFDDRFYYLVKKYSFERRTGHIREMNNNQLTELLDDLFYYSKAMKYYDNLLNDALAEINILIK